MKNPATAKFFGIAIVVVLLLLLGLSQIIDVVHQREAQRQTAVQGVAQSLAGSQTLVGPLAHMTCTEEWLGLRHSCQRQRQRQGTAQCRPAGCDLEKRAVSGGARVRRAHVCG